MRVLSKCPFRRATLLASTCAAFVTLSSVLSPASGQSTRVASGETNKIAQEIQSIEREIDRAIENRDVTALRKRLTDSFIRIHTLGPVESQQVFLARVANGTAFSRQRTDDWAEFDVDLQSYGGHTALRRSRLRFRFPKENRELWLLQLKVFVKETSEWRLASWHGTQLRSGTITDADRFHKLAGAYVSDDGERLVLSWHGGGILAEWPAPIGVVTQIFPISETEFEDGIRRLRFTLDSLQAPRSVAQVRDGKEVWRGSRSK